VDLKGICSIFEFIFYPLFFRLEFIGFPNRNNPCPEEIGDRGSKDKSSRLYGDNLVNPILSILMSDPIAYLFEGTLILKKCCNILEDNSGFRQIRNITNKRFQIHHLFMLSADSHPLSA